MKSSRGRSIKIIACIISLISILSVTGIFAYLTENDTTYNKFSIGEVRVQIEEPAWNNGEDLNENGIPDNAEIFKSNKIIKRNPQIVNETDNSAYVYFKVKVPVLEIEIENLKDENITEDNKNKLLYTYSINNKWKEITSARDVEYNNYGKIKSFNYVYYYELPVNNKDERTQSLFDEIKFSNLNLDKTESELPQIELEAYAIEIENLPTDITIEKAYLNYLNKTK